MRTPRWVPWVYLGPAVAVMAVACLVPLLSALQLGFYDWSMGTPWGEAKWVGTDAFVAAFKDPAVWRSLVTTLIFAAVCVVAEMLLGIALALALEGDVRGMAFFRTLFILPMMIAPIAVGLTWRYLLTRSSACSTPSSVCWAWRRWAGWRRNTRPSSPSSWPTSGSGRPSSSS
jgi:multiple sugar transport system permease protein